MPTPHKTPTALAKPTRKKVNGHEPVTNEPTPPDGMPDLPAFISEDAKWHWFNMGPALVKARVLSRIDQLPYAALCEATARYYRAEKALNEEGDVLNVKADRTGVPVRNPWLNILNETIKHVIALGAQFGLTPASRSKINLPPAPDGQGALSRFIKPPKSQEPANDINDDSGDQPGTGEPVSGEDGAAPE